MSVLGDFLPHESRPEYLDSSLTSGQIVYLEIDFHASPKPKYALLLAFDGGNAFLFLINSEVHPFVARHRQMASCQVKLTRKEYDFLRQEESFLNCSRVYLFPAADTRAQVFDDAGRIKGRISEATRNEVVRAVERSPNISEYHKRLIRESLKPGCTRE